MRPLSGLLVALALALALATCSSDSSGPDGRPGPPANVTKQAGDNQTTAAGQAVATDPTVLVTDAAGRPVPNVVVTFAVTSGGGSVVGAAQTTGSNGVAAVGSWLLGGVVGPNTLTATVAGSGIAGNPVTFTATALAGPAANLIKVAGDDQSGTPSTAVQVRPAVKVTDQHGNPIAGVTVTFQVVAGGGSITGGTPTTGAGGIATVGSWILGPLGGGNVLTASIAGAGVAGNPASFTATGGLAPFRPTTDTMIGGTLTVGEVDIPFGVMVTVTSNLVLNVHGPVAIAGVLRASCDGITINGQAGVTVTGILRNSCPFLPVVIPPTLRVVGKGGLTFNGSTVISSGPVELTDDPTLTDADFAAPAVAPPPSSTAAVVTCSLINASFLFPTRARDGIPDETGGPGRDGVSWALSCRGEIQIQNSSVAGQGGGNGGDGTHASTAGATAAGGDGGSGGLVQLRSVLALHFSGTNTVTGGSGGKGGNATATGTPNPAGAKAANAAATAGDGGVAGVVSLRGKGLITIGGTLNLIVGDGGAGGNATSVGADGANASTAPAQAGGDGRATAGAGGDTQDKTLSGGSVSGLQNLLVSGGNGGRGGVGDATAGKGGNGSRTAKQGAVGGTLLAFGGRGGDAVARDQNLALISTGGVGSVAFFRRATGGDGYDDCTPPLTDGGAGGQGGGASGGAGFGGGGRAPPAHGVTNVVTAGNGGNGGDGYGPGNNGAGGVDAITPPGTRLNSVPVFQPGAPGLGCVFQTTWTVNSDPGANEPVLQLTATTHQIRIRKLGGAGTFELLDLGLVLNGTINPVGGFTASGTGTLKGKPNTDLTFTGTINAATGALTGGLMTISGPNIPNGPVIYNITGSVLPP